MTAKTWSQVFNSTRDTMTTTSKSVLFFFFCFFSLTQVNNTDYIRANWQQRWWCRGWRWWSWWFWTQHSGNSRRQYKIREHGPGKCNSRISICQRPQQLQQPGKYGITIKRHCVPSPLLPGPKTNTARVLQREFQRWGPTDTPFSKAPPSCAVTPSGVTTLILYLSPPALE